MIETIEDKTKDQNVDNKKAHAYLALSLIALCGQRRPDDARPATEATPRCEECLFKFKSMKIR